jgi:hypothetical protein
MSSPHKLGALALVMSNGSFDGLAKRMSERGTQQFGSLKIKNKGQATVEYILVLFMVIFVIVGIFFPVVKETFEGIQDDLETNTQSVIAQDELGIPLAWFELEANDDLDVRINALNSGLSGDMGGPNGGDNGGIPPGANDQNPASKSPASGGGPGGGGVANFGGSSSDASSDDSSSPTLNNSNASSQRDNDSEDGNGNSSTTIEDREGQDSSGSFGSPQSGDDDQSDDASLTGAKEASEEDKDEEEGDVSGKALIYSGRDEKIRKGGCEEVDFSTLIKIIALLGIVLVGVIMVFTGRGGGKNAR